MRITFQNEFILNFVGLNNYPYLSFMDEITQIRLGQKIRKIREIKGLKQEAVAKEIGLTLNAYGKLERGETRLSVERLQQISNVFEVPVTSILEMDEGVSFNFSQNTFHNSNGGVLHQHASESNNEVSLLHGQIEVLQGVIAKMEIIIATQEKIIQRLEK